MRSLLEKTMTEFPTKKSFLSTVAQWMRLKNTRFSFKSYWKKISLTHH